MKTLPGMVDWFKSLELLTCISMPFKYDPILDKYDPFFINVWDTTNKGNIIKKIEIETSDRLVRGSYLNQIKAFVTYLDYRYNIVDEVNIVHVWDLRRFNCMETIEVGKGYFDCAFFI